MNDAASLFRDAIQAVGLTPPDVIEPGRLHRFPGVGKGRGNTAGWCILFEAGLGGCFGDWSSSLSETWQVKRNKPCRSLLPPTPPSTIISTRNVIFITAKPSNPIAPLLWPSGVNLQPERPRLLALLLRAS